MTFIISQVTKRANGQSIVRDRRIEKSRLTVGRGTSNDLFLSDLRVALEHLVLSISGTRLSVEAVGDKTFVLAGRAVGTAMIADGQQRDVLVGPYQLRIRLEEGAWRIEVERIEAEERLNEDEVDKIFTLKGTFLKKRGPAWVGFLALVAVFLALPVLLTIGLLPKSVGGIYDADGPWLSGPLSGGHANLSQECESCHVNAFEHVKDGTCIDCHNDVINHAEPARLQQAMAAAHGFDGFLQTTSAFFGKSPGECADCHREHNGDDGIIMTASLLCTDCHRDMSTRLTDTTLVDAGDFGKLHGNFRPMVVASPGPPAKFVRVSLDDAGAKDQSGLKFPHDLHLKADGGVANQARELGDEFGFGDALVCADCHESEPGGKLFSTVTMEANCQMCHSLVFERDGTTERRLQHGEPQEVIATLREFYRAQALGQAVAPTASDRRRPGGGSVVREASRRDQALVDAARNADAKVTAVFSEGGACFDCHEVIPAPPGTADFDIVPVTLVDRFLTKGVFDHAKHEVGGLNCASCHDAAHSALASDIILPGIDTRKSALSATDVVGCRDCHGGEDAQGDMVASACISCHGYHEGTGAPLMTAADMGRDHPPIRPFDPAQWSRISSAADLR